LLGQSISRSVQAYVFFVSKWLLANN
jgi:hypothetical protein